MILYLFSQREKEEGTVLSPGGKGNTRGVLFFRGEKGNRKKRDRGPIAFQGNMEGEGDSFSLQKEHSSKKGRPLARGGKRNCCRGKGMEKGEVEKERRSSQGRRIPMVVHRGGKGGKKKASFIEKKRQGFNFFLRRAEKKGKGWLLDAHPAKKEKKKGAWGDLTEKGQKKEMRKKRGEPRGGEDKRTGKKSFFPGEERGKPRREGKGEHMKRKGGVKTSRGKRNG